MSQNQDQFLPQEIGRDTMQAALALVEASSADRHEDVVMMLATCDPGQLQTGLLSITELLFDVVAQRTGVSPSEVTKASGSGVPRAGM